MSQQQHDRRYDRLKLIPWWDQDVIANATIMVVGAGAIGNEVLKNLALLGVGKILVIDFDVIEDTNLSRSILFRKQDVRRLKAEVAVERIQEINPDVHAVASTENIVDSIGRGVFRRMDLVIGALDNREARLAVNRHCWNVTTPWIDTGINTIDGLVRVFRPPTPPCYECTMSDEDYEIIRHRRSCQLLTPDVPFPAVPTTPTIASVVGGIAVQEALKLLHGINPEDAHGRGFMYFGHPMRSLDVNYSEREDCPSHVTLEPIEELPRKASETSLRELLDLGRKRLGEGVQLDLERDIVYAVYDPETDETKELLVPHSRLKPQDAVKDGRVLDVRLLHSLDGSESFLHKTPADIGIPAGDILTVRVGIDKFHSFEFTGDVPDLFGGLLA